jgi:broad specificity phosphatase PhoE
MKRVWLIRHAQSEANKGLPTDDPAQIALTRLGESQAQAIADSLIETPSLIVTSPYLRTKQTAAPTLMRLSTVPHEEWPVHEFTFLDPSRCVGTTPAQRRPMVAAYWERADPFYSDGPGAESFADFMGRITGTLTRLKTEGQPFTLIFGHGLFIRSLLWYIVADPQALSAAAMRQCRAFCESFSCPNGSILNMQLADDGTLFFSPFSTAHLPLPLRSLSVNDAGRTF